MNRRGVTLIEMLVVVAIVGVIAAVAVPSLTAGLESIRLKSAADSVGSFLSSALERAGRRQEVIEVIVDPAANAVVLYSTEPGFERRLPMPPSITITGAERRFLLQPNGTAPRIAITLAGAKGAKRTVTIDPITGVPQVSAEPGA